MKYGSQANRRDRPRRATKRGKEAAMSRKPDPAKRALILIDVQNDYFDGDLLRIAYPPASQTLPNLLRAARAAVEAGIPIVAVRQLAPEASPVFAAGSRGAALVDSVAALPLALVVDKVLPSALAGTTLPDWLRAQDIGTLTLAGYMTQNCVESTVRHALHEGYEVEVLADATGAVSYANRQGFASAETIHKTSLVVMQSRFAAVMDVAEWLDVLAGRSQPARDTVFGSALKARARA
jgi:nicotinamidase-related amidase